MNFPFKERNENGVLERTFDPTTPSQELIWHTDLEDRIITIKKCGGWKLQFDNELPKNLRDEERIFIPQGTWHRVIKGSEPLVVEIKKLAQTK